jgi:carbonic anhydrase
MSGKNFPKTLKNDLPAGIATFLVALPLCLGIALASTGRPELLFSGIIAGIIGGVVVGILSKSALGVSGPAAGLVVIVLNAIRDLGSFEALLLAVMLAGVIQVIAGFINAGVIGYYFPSAVIKGMLAGIGLILILKELPHAIGYEGQFMGDESFAGSGGTNTFNELKKSISSLHKGSFVVAGLSFLVLLAFNSESIKNRRLAKWIPGALAAVGVGVLANYLLGIVSPENQVGADMLVNLPLAASEGNWATLFIFPDFSSWNNPKVYSVAFTLAVVASLETLLCIEATDKLDPSRLKTPTNRELKAQGLGNILSGLIGGLPITQVIVRSSANIEAGAKTKASAIIHGLILMIAALTIPQWLNKIPLASLAAILILVGYKLSKPSMYTEMYRHGRSQFLPFITTIIAILLTDLLKGITLGILVSIFYILKNNYRNAFVFTELGDNSYMLKLAEEVSFLNKGKIVKILESLPEQSKVLIDGRESKFIDFDVVEAIEDFKSHGAVYRNINVQWLSSGQ